METQATPYDQVAAVSEEDDVMETPGIFYDLEENQHQKNMKTYKRSKGEESTSDFLQPKKTAKHTWSQPSSSTVSTHNYYTPLTTIMTTTTTTPTTSSNPTTPCPTQSTPSKPPNPPAIVIDKKCTNSKLLVQIKQTLRSSYTSSYNTQGLRIQCTTDTDYKTLQDLLLLQKLQFYTYQYSNNNNVKFVIRGLPPNISEEEILNEIQSSGLPAVTVRQFKRTQIDPTTDIRSKVPLPVWLTTLLNKEGVKEKMLNLTGLFNLKIRVENYEGTPAPVQCFRCQKFGHKAQGCNLQPKCFKCAENHNTRDCTKDPISPATCSNCNGPHPANYGQCPKFVAYSRPFSTASHPTPTFSQTTREFPQLPTPKGIIPNFRRQEQATPNLSNTTGNDLKVIVDLIKSFNLKNFLLKVKTAFIEVAKQPDTTSKCIALFSSLCSLFDNGCEN